MEANQAVLLMPLNEDQLLRLYDIETRQVHQQLDHILKIRATMALAFTAILSATLIYRTRLIGLLGALIFLGAWWWEYFYARYLDEHHERAGQLRKWIFDQTQDRPGLAAAYADTSGYDHRSKAVYKAAAWLGKRLGSDRAKAFVLHFFDLPRALAYSAMALSQLLVATLLV
jgi:hypothetical protein